MLFETEKQGEVLIVRPLESRLDASDAESFKSGLLGWINEPNNAIVLDFSYINFVDSSGLGAIVSVLKQMGRNGRIVVCNLQPPVSALFKLTRMDKVFSIFDDVETAVAAF
jgi:anti-sigma B factor antagonist